ncbi:DNA-binding response regulator [Gemmatimonadetes bacterium T265]|nr:DNA-binding response regulator [Gemmatimonadetes bacterium T265]
MLRVLVAGDIRIYRDGIVAHLRSLGRFAVVATAASPDETVARGREFAPDVVVLDMAMPASLDVARELLRAAPGTKVVALTVPDVEHAIVACAEAGVAGYVPREGSLDDLVAATDRAVRGEVALSTAVAAGLFRRVAALAAALDMTGAAGVAPGRGAGGPPAAGRPAGLTPREREIVALIERGLSNKQIAAQLHIELATVKNHVHNVLEKLHVRRRGDAAARWQRPAALFALTFDPTHRLVE